MTPGPDMMYVVTFGLTRGWRGGLSAATGIALGMIFHTVLAAVGVSLVLRLAEWPLVVLRFAGAAYLLYLGVQMIRDRSGLAVATGGSRFSYGRIVGSSTLVNVTNPKILVFYLTFLPQFTDQAAGDVGFQLAFLGALFALMGFLTDATIGLLSGRIAQRAVDGDTRWLRRVRGVGGAILCALAVAVVATPTT
ncbi:LysE family translocator [Saccharothrix algeriensis]|uniref:LysE family translocator n=1 Tax=Saccharothrix algeriensis TaxID=173560 RepID=A0A8T8HW50_9PSEU|nr:LysE family translocator [Saccharothrix algeriensis]